MYFKPKKDFNSNCFNSLKFRALINYQSSRTVKFGNHKKQGLGIVQNYSPEQNIPTDILSYKLDFNLEQKRIKSLAKLKANGKLRKLIEIC